MNVDLRKLELHDLNDIERIERESYPTPWSRSMFAGELAKPSSLSLGAFDRETGALLERLFEVTSSDERRGYTLEVRVSNEGAIALYERLGFVARGVRRGYYTDNREDALIMWRDPVPDQKAEHEQAEAG
jgi:[ribosomal protein S18]-alanine N-acetyltransferase